MLLAQRALDCGACLAPVEDDRLVVQDAPLIEHVRVGADRIGAAAWIEAGGPEITGCLEAHHVGRGEQPASPELGDRMAAQEGEDGIARRAQLHLDLKPQHHEADAVGAQTRHHADQVGRGETGTQGDDAGIERDELVLGAWWPAKQDPREPGQAIDLDKHRRQLGLADSPDERGPHPI